MSANDFKFLTNWIAVNGTRLSVLPRASSDHARVNAVLPHDDGRVEERAAHVAFYGSVGDLRHDAPVETRQRQDRT